MKAIKNVFLIIMAPIWVPFWMLVKVCKWMDERGITIETRSGGARVATRNDDSPVSPAVKRNEDRRRHAMYCVIKGTWVEVVDDDGRCVRKLIGFRGPIESAYMSGNDKVVVTYSNGGFRYTELWDVSGKMIRRTRC